MSEINVEDFIIKKPCAICGELTHRFAIVLGGDHYVEFWVCSKHELTSTIVLRTERQ